MAGEGSKLATGWLELTVSTDGAQKSITDGVMPGATAAGDAAGKTFGNSFSKILGAGVIVGAVVLGFKKLYEVGSIFDDVADTIRVGTGATGEALDSLTASARKVGTSVPADFTAVGSVVADLNTRLGLTGGTLETVASQYLEAGRILDQEVDIQGTTAAFSAFGIEGDAVSSSMDNLFRVSQATGVGMNELAAAARAQAPALKILGFSFEDTISLVGGLDKAGLNSTAVMASMSKGLVALAKKGEEPQAAFKRVTAEISALVESGDKAAAIDLASGIFGTKGAVQFIGAVESGTIAFDDLMASTGAGQDTILGVAMETRDLAESWKMVKNNGLDIVAPAADALFALLGNGMGKLADLMGKLPAMAIGVKSLFIDGDFTASFREAFDVEEDSPIVNALFNIREGFVAFTDKLGPMFTILGPQLLTLWQAFSPLSLIFQAIGPQLPGLVSAFADLALTVGGILSGALVVALPLITDLSGILVDILGGVVTFIIPALTWLASVVSENADFLLVMGIIVGGMILAMRTWAIVTGVITALSYGLAGATYATGTAGTIVTGVTKVWTAGQWLLNAALTANPIGLIVAGILLLVAAIVWVATQTTFFQDTWAAAAKFVTGIWEALPGFFTAIWDGIVAGISWAIGFILDLFFTFHPLGILIKNWGAITEFFKTVMGNIGSFVADGISNIIGFFTSLPKKIVDSLSSLGGSMVDLGKNLIEGLIKGAGSILKNLGSFFLDIVPAFIREPFKKALGINSPSKLFAEFGVNTMEGYLIGVGSMEAETSKQMSKAVTLPDIAPFDYGNTTVESQTATVVPIGDADPPADPDPIDLSDSTINKLAQAIVGLTRIQGRQGTVVL